MMRPTNNRTNEHVVRLRLDGGDLVTHFPTAAVASKWVEKFSRKLLTLSDQFLGARFFSSAVRLQSAAVIRSKFA